MFAATTNDEAYLTDPTGNRRFQPVLLGEIDRAKLLQDRDQLWAEAVHIYKAAKTCTDCLHAAQVVPGEDGRCPQHAWWLSADQKTVAKVHACLRNEEDVWAQAVLKFAFNPVERQLNTTSEAPKVPLTTENVLRHALQVEAKDLIKIGPREGLRIAGILKRAGFHRDLRGANSIWIPPTPPDPPVHHS